jgi:dTDP-N-acetylfucosamine:lipid II N-acetylfucosaminyltransferase
MNNLTRPILHIAPDEKFINTAYEIYERALPGKNQFIILLQDRQTKVKHVSLNKDYHYFFLNEGFTDDILSLINFSKVVVFHGLAEFQAKISLKINNDKIKKIWSIFGFEVYDNPHLFNQALYGRKTREKYFGKKYLIKKILKPYFFKLLKNEDYPLKSAKKALKNMDVMSTLIEEEYDLFKEISIIKKDTLYLKFTYFPLDLIIKDENEISLSKNILVGNSAFYTNNHLDVFAILSGMNLNQNKIIVPLSYGFKDYANDIIKVGESLFGSNFLPITEYLSFEDYNNAIKSCGIVIMNHYRQQAVGNILMALFRGAKVYLNNKNILFNYFKRLGCNIYSIEDDLNIQNPLVFELLDEEQIQHNRNILKIELDLERICDNIKDTLSPWLYNH